MPHYDATRFEPPAPLAQVTICNPDNGTLNPDVPMLLDSGADVPKTAIGSKFDQANKLENPVGWVI